MTVYPNTAPRTLSDPHCRMLLEESAISPDVAAGRGTFTARRGKDVPQEHGWLPAKPGVVFPVHTLDGGIFYRLRPDNPGRYPKYMQPKGAPNRLDVHPSQHERVKKPGGMRYITEGERKVDSGVSRGLLMVGVSGVFNGQRDKGAALIDDFGHLPMRGERYSVLFDSDIETNPSVQLAAQRYARLLREAGAEVFITLLPPAPDGSKQGLDDFFANGGTVKELELLTRPFDLEAVATVRLSRDDKLRAAVGDLWRRYWAFEWKGMGAETAQDVALKLIDAARQHGKAHPDGIRVVKAQGPLALEAKVSGRTLWKCINRLEEWGFLYRDNETRKPDKPGAFVLRASVSHMEETPAAERRVTGGVAPGDLHLRAPRLMCSRPKWKPTKKMIREHRLGRLSHLPPPREGVRRLGKSRCHLFDALDAAGGTLTLGELGRITNHRPRDLVRRKATEKGREGLLIWPETAGIVVIDGEAVSLAPDWLERLEDQRRLGEEIEAGEVAKRRYRAKSRAYHQRNEPQKSAPSPAGLEAMRRSRELRARQLSEREPEKPEPTAAGALVAAVRDYLERNPRAADPRERSARELAGWLAVTLWALELVEGKPDRDEVRAAIDALGGEKFLRENMERAGRAA